MHDYYDWRLESGDRVQRADGRYLTDYWTDEAIEFLKRSPKDPFYLHLTYNAPHTPLQAPEEDLAVFRDRDDLSEAVKTLYAMIRRLDRNVGRLLENVDKLGLRENTLIVFSSDNGPQFGGSGDDCLDRFNCQLHGSKGSTYEGGIRVPAVVRWPAGLKQSDAGDNTFFHMCDWLPTLLSMAGVAPPKGLKLDGVDQTSALRGEDSSYKPKRCWQWNRYDPQIEYNAAIRDGDWKLVRPFVPEAFEVPDIKWLDVSMYEPEHFIENGIITDPAPEVILPPAPPVELYNLNDDPLEQNNLALQRPQRVQHMERDLHTWFEDVCNDLKKTSRD
jgi:arylsulfatase A